MATTESTTSAWYGAWFRYSPISLFAAGFISVLVFQMGALAILNAFGFTPATPFAATRTWPLGVPQTWSWAFWGGVWGLLLREVVSGEVLLVLDRGDPVRRDLADGSPLVRRFSAQGPADRGGVGSDQDGNSPHPPRRMGIGHGPASTLSSISTEQAARRLLPVDDER
jgi:hypothetical protein